MKENSLLVKIHNNKIKKDKKNQVTSHFILKPRYARSGGNYTFHEEGLFSNQIFGSIDKCTCKKQIGEGYCKECNERVVDFHNMPDNFIDLETYIPLLFADFKSLSSQLKLNATIIEKILKYQGFVFNGTFYPTKDEDDKFIEYLDIDIEKISIGVDAVKKLIPIKVENHEQIIDKWVEKNMTDFILVPHPIYRPIISNGGANPLITPINDSYSSLIKSINDISSLDGMIQNKLFLLEKYKGIYNNYLKTIDLIMEQVQENNYSIIKSEVISHPISGAIRATLTNRHDAHENVLLIGDTMIKTLFPWLYKKHNGDMISINSELIDENYLVLINRPPTISNLSIMSMKPRIASLYPFSKTKFTSMCLEKNIPYELIYEPMGCEVDGDIEKFENKIPFEDYNYNLMINEFEILNERLDKGNIDLNTYKNNILQLEILSQSFKNYFHEKTMEMEKSDIRKELKGTIFRDMIDYYIKNKDNIQNNYIIGDRKGLRCVSCNSIIADGLAGDYDGDVILVIALYSKESTLEAERILPSKSFINYANGEIRNIIIPDFFYGIKYIKDL